MAEYLGSEEGNEVLLSDSIFRMQRHEAFYRPAQQRHFVAHRQASAVEIPGEHKSKQKAGGQKSAILVYCNPINIGIFRVLGHAGQLEVIMKLRIT